ncbi:hypothetical protein MMC20_005568 [Loxospora ochrophaea]|nr:hypothetical protein [Loxospora ochrophaea]
MSERDFRKKFTGNTSFYKEQRLHRSRLFLSRNIERVLKYHTLQLHKHRTKSANLGVMATSSDSYENGPPFQETGRRYWSLDDLAHSLEEGPRDTEGAMLRIEVKGIKDKRDKVRTRELYSEPPHKRLRISSIRAQCALTIWDSRFPRAEQLVKQSRACTITSADSQQSQKKVDIAMDEPFMLRADELFVQSSQGRNSKFGIGSAYLMQIAFQAADASELWPPPSLQLKEPKIREVEDHGELVRFPLLLAKWSKLPQCPHPGALLEVSNFHDGKSYRTKLGLDIEASWSAACTPLMLHNQRIRERSPLAAQLPTPLSETEPLRSIIVVKWLFQGRITPDEVPTYSSYICPFCNDLDLKNMDAFHFHLINSHDLLKVHIVSEGTRTVDGRAKMAVKVNVDVADDYRERAANHVLDDREMVWKKPNTWFDLQAYLDGDERWLGKIKRRNVNLVPPKLSKLSRSASGDLDGSEDHELKTRAPEDVPDMPFPARKKHTVPPAEDGMKYFRNGIKRPLREGEAVSESDDEINESWLWQKHDETVNSFSDLSTAEKEFITCYDKSIMAENVSSRYHVGEFLIRFCRVNQKWLKREDMRTEFHKKAADLALHGVVAFPLIRACKKIIDEPVEDLCASDVHDR